MRLVVAFNTVSQLLGKLFGAGATFFISLLIAQTFGVAGYGDFVKITTYISFFFLIADFGLNAIYLQKQKDVSAFSTLLSARVFGGIFLVFLSLALLAFLPQGTTDGYTNAVRFGIILFSPAILFQGLITTTNAIFQKRLRYDLATVSLAIGSIVSIGILLLMLQTSLSPSLIGPIALLGGTITTTVIAFWFVKKLNELSPLTFSLKQMHGLLWSSLPLGLTLLFTLVYGHIDSVILTLTRNTTEVGVYGLAYKAFELLLVVPTFFMNAVYPLLVKADTARFHALLKKSFIFLLVTSFFLSIITWICAPFLAYIQEGFAASVPALRVLSLSLPFFFLSSFVMWALIALKKQFLLAVIYGLAMILNISLNLWLIPMFGYMAAAWTTVIGEGLVLLLSGFFVLRYSPKI
jgi:O-antigen/teichoic acid export membrane protein